MSSLKDALAEYLNSLKELTFNSKPTISMLTMCAEEFIADAPEEIVKLILERVISVNESQKLPLLYLIDSICKNLGSPYVGLFGRNIVTVFAHVFEHGDETIRSSLYKLRKTWVDIFPSEKLYAIDSAAKSIDPAWPVIAPRPSKNSFSSSPVKRKSANDSTSSQTSSTKRKTTNDSIYSSSSSTTNTTSSSTASSGNRKCLLDSQSSNSPIKRKSTAMESSSTTSLPIKRKHTNEASTVASIKRKPTSGSTLVNKDKALVRQKDRILPSVGAQDRDYRKEFEALIHEAGKKLNDGVLSNQDHDYLVQAMQRAMKDSPSGLGISSLSIKHPSPPSQAPPPVQVPSAAAVAAASNILGLASSLANQQQQSTTCTGLNSTESTMITTNDNNQQFVVVDKNLVKLFYLDENTSIVLMKGPLNMSLHELVKANPYDLEPRLIMFEGKSTKVYIDSDKGSKEFVLLNFNSQPQTFFHGEHAQRIRLGGPCREIILNGKSYQASFGGPPIEVWFAGDTQTTHTLRLSGPPPRVKISEDIRVDLWNEYVKKITGRLDETSTTVTQSAYASLPSSSLLVPTASSTVILPPSLVPTSGSPLNSFTTPLSATTEAIPVPVVAPATALSTGPLTVPVPISATVPLTVPVPGATAISAPVTTSAPVPAVVAPTVEPLNFGDLFEKLASFGIFKKETLGPETRVPLIQNNDSRVPATSSPSSSISTTTTTTSTTATAPSYSKENESNLTDEPEIPLTLEVKSLKADHPKVIADLINGIQCPNCSLRFEVVDSNERSKYSVHLDWHFRLNRQERTDSKSKTASIRRWLCPLDLWITFKEITDESEETVIDDNDNEGQARKEKISTVPATEDESLNECAVCKEKFETTWNEDEEEWQLLNAVLGQDEKIYHPLCLEDLLKQRSSEDHEMSSLTNGPDESIKSENIDKIPEELTVNDENNETINSNKKEVDEEEEETGRVKEEKVEEIKDDECDDGYTLYPTVLRGQVEVSVCCIS